ncbi:sulfatase-like hydrolase/transferase [candidate division KSB1 bacterium]|nr:sulfatase-like hydrolase/transferase [candidate division KSB1 bacterium]
MATINLSRRKFLKTTGLGAVALGMSGTFGLTSCSRKNEHLPNIVIIFTDDQGYADVGSYGAKGFTTPHLDKMAEDGKRFTSFYVSQAVCSASRASLLTGCYSERVSIQGALNPWTNTGLNPEEETIADMLKKKGYATGIFGKWHLGHYKEFLPAQQGFDEYLGLPYSNDMWPVHYDGKPMNEGRKSFYPPLPLIDGVKKVAEINTLDDQATLTTRYTERAVQFIEKNKNNPFFLYIPHSMPHVPLGVSEKFKGKSEQGMYGDVIMEIDWSVGQIMKTLENNGLEENTLVIFASDNGPWMNYGNHAGSADPLREGKGAMWEGGARVPCIMRWPGRIPAGSENKNIAATMDILPTLAAITSAPLPEKKIDGVNILSLLEGDSKQNPRDSYFYYYAGELRAVRQGKWKLYFPHNYRSYKGVEPGKDGFPGPYASAECGLELYDLENDISETKDIADQFPEVVKNLQTLADKKREELGDRLTNVKGKEVREPGRKIQQDIKDIKHLAIGKKISLKTEPSPRYTGGGKTGLINGIRGSWDYLDGKWHGYEGNDFEAFIDLEKKIPVKKITCGFLSQQMSWIFLPSKLEIYVSVDGKKYDLVQKFKEKLKISPKAKIKNYEAKVKTRPVRYVNVKARNVAVCPDWHPGAGGKAWLFVDEIIVE